MKKNTQKKAFKPLVFLKEVRSELKKASWPTREQAIRLTGVVIAISLVVALYVGGLDYLFTTFISFVVQQ